MPFALAPARIRQHLKLEDDQEDDGYLAGLAAAAVRAVELQTGHTISGSTVTMSDADLIVASHAALLLIATWYANREAVSVGGSSAPSEVPLSVQWLLSPLKKWSV